MKKELKRALYKKSNLLVIIFVTGIMLINAYYAGWHNALGAPHAEDLKHLDDLSYYFDYYGNTLKVWVDGSYLVPVIAPILLLIPYGLSYAEEKTNHFRYLMIAREGRKDYTIHKLCAVVLSGIALLFIGEIIFYAITWFLTENIVDVEALEYIGVLNQDAFNKSPYVYFVISFLLKYIIYVSMVIFSFGIISFLSNKVGIITTPFIIFVIGALILPKPFVYDIALNNLFAPDYNLIALPFYFLLLNTVGLGSLYYSESELYKNG